MKTEQNRVFDRVSDALIDLALAICAATLIVVPVIVLWGLPL